MLLLLYYKVSVEVQDNNGNMLFYLVCIYGYEDCVKVLVYYDVELCRFDIGNEKGDIFLYIVVCWGY